MDRNSIIGLVIIGAVIIGYGIFSSPSDKDIEKARKQHDSIVAVQQKEQVAKELLAKVDSAKKVEDKLKPDTIKKNEEIAQLGNFAKAVDGQEQFITLENKHLRIKFTNKGAKVYSVQLKEYLTHDKKPLVLFDENNNEFGLAFFSQNRSISTNNLFFQASTTEKNISATNKPAKLSFKLFTDSVNFIEYVYSLEPNDYLMKFSINLNGVNKTIAENTSYITLNWKNDVRNLERGRQWESDNTSIYYKFLDEDVNYLNETSPEASENLRTKVKWIAYKQQFFSTILMADNYLLNATLKSVKLDTSKISLKRFTSEISLPFENKDKQTIPLTFYFGPNQYKLLKTYNKNFENLVPLGWGVFGWMNKYLIIPIFNFFGSFLSNYGLIIFLLTITIKIILFPLTYKSYLSTAKMRVLKPQIDEINAKIPKDKTMERQQATMALYKKAGVNPMGGCIPMLLQFPILIALFRFFPASIELRQQGFLWADDLSSYDSILTLPGTIPFYGDHISLFTLLMCGSLILTTLIQNNQMTTGTQMPGMKIMMWMMPVMMLFWFNNYAAGLSYYYFLANMITYIQTIVIRRFVNDEEILSRIETNKAKPVKKSKFQMKLEEMTKKRGLKK